jgi:penicillin-binding protein 2
MQYDAYLRGTLGSERFEVDGRGRRRKEMGEVPAKAGDTLVLALDARVQEAAEKALGGNPGAVVAIDPRNGHILAMASGPTYDLNLRTRPMTTAESDMLNKDKVKRPLLNRTIARFPPGSTFKIITMAAGLATGKLPGGVDCHGSFPMGGGKPKKCHGTHGSVSPTSAFAQSCDIFYYKAGERIGDVKLAEWAGKFGLGKVTGLDFPYEKAGTIPTKKWVTEELKEGWWRGNLYDMAIGQGYDEATPLQIALVAATIANGGTIWQPHLVDRVVDSDDPKQVLLENKPVELGKLGLSKDHIGQIQRAMRSVVESGTGKAAAVSGIEVYGKTGTAETGVSAKTHGWFTGYAARRGEAPSIAVCVFREALKSGDHYHGGDVCAPAAHHVIETYFSSEPTTPPVPKPTPAPSRRRRSR